MSEMPLNQAFFIWVVVGVVVAGFILFNGPYLYRRLTKKYRSLGDDFMGRFVDKMLRDVSEERRRSGTTSLHLLIASDVDERRLLHLIRQYEGLKEFHFDIRKSRSHKGKWRLCVSWEDCSAERGILN